MIYYLLEGFNVIGKFDEKDPGSFALPLLTTGKEMSLITEAVFKALMANLELTPQDALTALSITDTRKDVPEDDCLKPVEVKPIDDVKPIEDIINK